MYVEKKMEKERLKKKKFIYLNFLDGTNHPQ